MPYNYVVGHDNSTSLAEAPKAIKEAVRRMTWAAKRIVPDKEFVGFNELLAIGYLESMKMNVRALSLPPANVRYLRLIARSFMTTVRYHSVLRSPRFHWVAQPI